MKKLIALCLVALLNPARAEIVDPFEALGKPVEGELVTYITSFPDLKQIDSDEGFYLASRTGGITLQVAYSGHLYEVATYSDLWRIQDPMGRYAGRLPGGLSFDALPSAAQLEQVFGKPFNPKHEATNAERRFFGTFVSQDLQLRLTTNRKIERLPETESLTQLTQYWSDAKWVRVLSADGVAGFRGGINGKPRYFCAVIDARAPWRDVQAKYDPALKSARSSCESNYRSCRDIRKETNEYFPDRKSCWQK